MRPGGPLLLQLDPLYLAMSPAAVAMFFYPLQRSKGEREKGKDDPEVFSLIRHGGSFGGYTLRCTNNREILLGEKAKKMTVLTSLGFEGLGSSFFRKIDQHFWPFPLFGKPQASLLPR